MTTVEKSPAEQMRFTSRQLVQEFGHGQDCDEELRDGIRTLIEAELVDETSRRPVDVVLLWHREGDGDLIEALTGAQANLSPDGTIWLLTPRKGREGYVEPGDIMEAITEAGLPRTGNETVVIGENWGATRAPMLGNNH
ncbi:DUF3052 domain-containing protein [Streptomyces vinaceus]|uniref:DUF3052 domain-containing protein n=1 Tax=Streptomyces vinaceus TaxID=1960 RepID=UPI00381F5D14